MKRHMQAMRAAKPRLRLERPQVQRVLPRARISAGGQQAPAGSPADPGTVLLYVKDGDELERTIVRAPLPDASASGQVGDNCAQPSAQSAHP
jgi:hypothetical protein